MQKSESELNFNHRDWNCSDLAEAEDVGLVLAPDGVHDDERPPGIEAARHDAVVVGHVADPLDALAMDFPLFGVRHEPTMLNQLLQEENAGNVFPSFVSVYTCVFAFFNTNKYNSVASSILTLCQ